MEASLALGFTVQDTAHCSQRDPVGSGIMTLSRLITKADNGDDWKWWLQLYKKIHFFKIEINVLWTKQEEVLFFVPSPLSLE